MTEFPFPYPDSRVEAQRRGEMELFEESFRQNVCCARDIEQAIRDYYNETDEDLNEGCAQSVLEQYGFRRVNLVLANSLEKMGFKYLISDEIHQWGQTFVPADDIYNCYFAVFTAAALLESFIRQARDAYEALGLFGPEHCVEESEKLDYTGKVLVLRPDVMYESRWSPQNCLWEARGGSGCNPASLTPHVYAVCLGDGDRDRWWDRKDFVGVLKDEFLPDWAREKLEELHAPKQGGPSMGGMS